MAVRQIDEDLQRVLGAQAFDTLSALLDALGSEDGQPRLRDYLRYASRLDDPVEST
jgi:hypothetical protein